jgi:hypothetical protein
MNPSLQKSALYGLNIPEYKRVVVSRFRLIAHNLRIETGRWSRIPPEDRMCQCQTGVQSEKHVIEECPLVSHIWEKYRHVNFTINNLLKCDTVEKVEAIYDVVNFYDSL